MHELHQCPKGHPLESVGAFCPLCETITTVDPPPTLPLLPKVPGVEVIERLGEGGMGVVYRARQVSLGRFAALKVMKGRHFVGEKAARDFRAEAEAVAKLNNPNFVQIYLNGDDDGWPYFLMELVEGGSLDKKLKGQPQPPAEAAAMVETLARAMHEAHRRGIVHRDLKPGNILMTADGSPKISDFGLALSFEEGSFHSAFGTVVGTPSYMAPEQAMGESGDFGPHTDIYALGAILYEMLTGRPPFLAPSVMETVRQVLDAEPVSPRRLQPGTPRDLETICLKCLEKEPARRYATAAELANDLRRFSSGVPILARRTGLLNRAVKWSKRHPARAGLAVAIPLALAALAAVFVGREYQAKLENSLEQTEEQRKLAEQQKIIADEQKVIADEQKRLARRQGYAAAVGLAQKAWNAGDLTRARALLEGQIPATGEEDFRHFEWHYLWRLLHSALAELPPQSHPVVGIHFNEEGDRLFVATGGFDGNKPRPSRVAIWDPVNLKELAIIPGVPDGLRAFAGSPDGRWLATATEDGGSVESAKVLIWNATDGSFKAQLPVKDLWTRHLAFSRDGLRLAGQGFKQKFEGELERSFTQFVQIWNVLEARDVAALEQSTNRYNGVLVDKSKKPDTKSFPEILHLKTFALDPFGLRTLEFGKTTALPAIVDVDTGRRVDLQVPKGTYLFRSAFSPNGRYLAFLGGSQNYFDIYFYEAQSGALIGRTQFPISSPKAIVFDETGSKIAVGTDSGWILIWNLAGFWSRLPMANVGDSVPRKTSVIELGRPDVIILADKRPIESLEFAASGTLIASASDGRAVKVWDATRAQDETAITRALSADTFGAREGSRTIASAIAIKANSSTLLALDHGGPVLWDAEKLETVGPVRAFDAFWINAAISKDGEWVAVVFLGKNRQVKIWKVSELLDKKPPRHTLTDLPDAFELAFSPDLRWFAASTAAKVQLWPFLDATDIGTKKPQLTLDHDAEIELVHFSPSGDRLVVVTKEQTAQSAMKLRLEPEAGEERYQVNPRPRYQGKMTVWNLSEGLTATKEVEWPSQVDAVAFSSNGSRIAMALGNGELRLQELSAPRNFEVLTISAKFIASLAFTADGTRLAAGAWDGRIQIWDLTTRQEVLDLNAATRKDAFLLGPSYGRQSRVGLAFSPDGRLLAYSGANFAMRIFDARDPKSLPPANWPTVRAKRDAKVAKESR